MQHTENKIIDVIFAQKGNFIIDGEFSIHKHLNNNVNQLPFKMVTKTI